MATADEIRALVRSHVDGDHERFRATVLVIAANAEARKSFTLAKSLRALADRSPRSQQMNSLTALPHHQMGDSLAMRKPTIRLDDMVLDAETRARVDRVVMEHGARDKLREHDLRPLRKLLLVGPPGVGKTMFASALACQLDLPMLRVELHAVITSHLGETAAHLGKIFDNVRIFRGVYFFDEFDALAAARSGDRTGGTDVGEMRRVVNSLLGFIEQDDSDSLIIAATNHVDMIDHAMFRRFDEVITFPMPTAEVARQLIESRLIGPVLGIDWEAVIRVADGVGHADLVNACDHASKDMILAGDERVDTAALVAAISARRASVTIAVRT